MIGGMSFDGEFGKSFSNTVVIGQGHYSSHGVANNWWIGGPDFSVTYYNDTRCVTCDGFTFYDGGGDGFTPQGNYFNVTTATGDDLKVCGSIIT